MESEYKLEFNPFYCNWQAMAYKVYNKYFLPAFTAMDYLSDFYASYIKWEKKDKNTVVKFSTRPINEQIDILHKILMATRLDLYSLANKVSAIDEQRIENIVTKVSEKLAPKLTSIVDDYLDTVIDTDGTVILYSLEEEEEDDDEEGSS